MKRLVVALLLAMLAACSSADRRAEHIELAMAALESGDFVDAQAHADEVHEDPPADPSAREVIASIYRALGEAAEEEGELANAAEAFAKAATHEPYRKVRAGDWFRAWQNARDAGKDGVENASYLDAAIEANPNDLEVRRAAATVYDELGQPADAAVHYLWVWEANRKDVAVGLRLGALYVQLGELDDAEAIFRRVIRVDPANVQANLQLADVYEEMGRASRSRGIYQDLIREHPDNPSLLFRFADFLDRIGSSGEADRMRARARGELPGVKRRKMRKLRRRN